MAGPFNCQCEGRRPEAISWGKERLLRFADNDSEDNRKTLGLTEAEGLAKPPPLLVRSGHLLIGVLKLLNPIWCGHCGFYPPFCGPCQCLAALQRGQDLGNKI